LPAAANRFEYFDWHDVCVFDWACLEKIMFNKFFMICLWVFFALLLVATIIEIINLIIHFSKDSLRDTVAYILFSILCFVNIKVNSALDKAQKELTQGNR
jgi:hypothetical protein